MSEGRTICGSHSSGDFSARHRLFSECVDAGTSWPPAFPQALNLGNRGLAHTLSLVTMVSRLL